MNQMVKVFSHSECDLGEGIFFDAKNRQLYWVDINHSIIYRKHVDETNDKLKLFKLKTRPSTILSVHNERVVFVDSNGISSYALNTNKYTIIKKTPLSCHLGSRANDATVLSDGSILYGTMLNNPTLGKGGLFQFKEDRFINELHNEITIPNTFIELDIGCLISDSYENETYLYSQFSSKDKLKKLWKSHPPEFGTPDGGCTDKKGNIYIAMWDGFAVRVFDKGANHISTIQLPTPRPTNCILIDETRLFVTTAKEGLTDEEIKLYPHSGNVLEVELERIHE